MMLALFFRGSMVSGAANVETLFAMARIVIPLTQEGNDVRKATYDRGAPNPWRIAFPDMWNGCTSVFRLVSE
jgi:hypothetical protein